MRDKIRRVVTGHDKNGRAVVIADGNAGNVFLPPHRDGVIITNLWRTESMPVAVPMEDEDPVDLPGDLPLIPPKNGSVFRIIKYPPDATYMHKITREAAHESFTEFGAGDAADASENPPHPMMHKTNTLDYAIVLEGEIYMVLDDSEVRLEAGDTVIQRATNHSWSNKSDKPAWMLFVLMDGKAAWADGN